MCHENAQVEFDFGSRRIIFATVMPLGFRKIPIRILTGSQEYTDQVDMVLFELFSAMSCTLHLCILVLGNF